MKQYILNIALLICTLITTQTIYAQGIIKNDFLVNDDTAIVDHHFPVVTMNNSGNFIIAWNDERYGWDDWDIFFQRYNSDGNLIGMNVRANDDVAGWPQVDATVAMNDAGNFVVAWEDERPGFRCIYYQIYDSNGNPVGNNRRANEVDAVGLDPAIAMDDAGYFVIAWKDHRNSGDRDIFFQLFDSGGNKIGSNVKANDDSGSAHQEAPSIVMDGNGSFTIVWDDLRDGSVVHVYLQRYDSNGNPLGSNVRVDDDPGNSGTTSIAMDSNSNFVIVWGDDRIGAGGIYFQMYDANGNTIGSNVKVSDDVGNINHSFPNVAMESSGDFVVTWRSYTTLNTDDVEGQRYFANGLANGGNYLVVIDGPNQIESVPWVAANSSIIAFAWTDNRRTFGRFDTYGKLVTWNWNGVTDVEIVDNSFPSEFSLLQNYPNPFNPSTKISFRLAEEGFTSLKVYDVLGNEVATLVNEEKPAGGYEVEFNTNRHSRENGNLTSGVYFYQLKAGSYTETKKSILLK